MCFNVVLRNSSPGTVGHGLAFQSPDLNFTEAMWGHVDKQQIKSHVQANVPKKNQKKKHAELKTTKRNDKKVCLREFRL